MGAKMFGARVPRLEGALELVEVPVLDIGESVCQDCGDQ